MEYVFFLFKVKTEVMARFLKGPWATVLKLAGNKDRNTDRLMKNCPEAWNR